MAGLSEVQHMITAGDLAAEIGINKSNLLKAARKLGLRPVKKVIEHHGQPQSVFNDAEEEVMRERYKHLLQR